MVEKRRRSGLRIDPRPTFSACVLPAHDSSGKIDPTPRPIRFRLKKNPEMAVEPKCLEKPGANPIRYLAKILTEPNPKILENVPTGRYIHTRPGPSPSYPPLPPARSCSCSAGVSSIVTTEVEGRTRSLSRSLVEPREYAPHLDGAPLPASRCRYAPLIESVRDLPERRDAFRLYRCERRY